MITLHDWIENVAKIHRADDCLLEEDNRTYNIMFDNMYKAIVSAGIFMSRCATEGDIVEVSFRDWGRDHIGQQEYEIIVKINE